MNPFYDNHLFSSADIKRAKANWRDKLRFLLSPTKVQCSEGWAYFYKSNGGKYLFIKREPLPVKPTNPEEEK